MILFFKKTSYLILFLFFLGIDLNAQIVIEITNIKELKGNIELGLYDDPKVFLSETEQYKVLYYPVEDAEVIITIDSIPEGWYAISLMHDLNSDGEMEKNFIGYPLEPFAFSNNIKPRFSKPDFEDCQFYYDGKKLELTIELIQ